MLSFVMDRFAMTRKGAVDFLKAVAWTTLLNLSLMLPAVFIFLFLDDYLRGVFDPASAPAHGLWYYVILALAFMAVMWLIAVFQYKSTYLAIYTESANRRLNLAEKLRILPLAFFGEKNLSDLTATIMNDTTDLEHTFSHAVPQVFAATASILLMAIGLFFYNWQLSLALFWVVPLAVFAFFLSKKFQMKNHRVIYDRKRDVSEHIQEGLDTIQEIKAYRLEHRYRDRLENKLGRYEKSLISGELLNGMLLNVSVVLLKLGLATVIIVGARLLTAGTIDLFIFLIFLMIASRIYEPVNEVFNSLAALFYLDIRIRRMREMEALPVQQGLEEFSPASFDITFEHVDFSYESDKQVLSDVNFTARQGEITALVGPSGGGKTTSAKLAARFWDASCGRILLGGEDISGIDPEVLLKHYSVVFQDVVLFNASVMENIRLGRRDASDEEVVKVARLARCDEFVSRLPEGYQTVIGENGETLSGGERQRISIARALLKDAPIVLLDEATASIDVENETLIQAGISELIRDKTVIIIAHRMRTVANADKVVVLHKGEVVENGDPQKLILEGGIFAGMVDRQMSMD
ncbi:MAG: ABC transporter ATP-binding protein [Bacteroidales bacterium]|nr:ABC transporter ATP-binding protein [Bacteroidales bacterium]